MIIWNFNVVRACVRQTAWQEVKLMAEIEGASGPVGGSHVTASASDGMWLQMLKAAEA